MLVNACGMLMYVVVGKTTTNSTCLLMHVMVGTTTTQEPLERLVDRKDVDFFRETDVEAAIGSCVTCALDGQASEPTR